MIKRWGHVETVFGGAGVKLDAAGMAPGKETSWHIHWDADQVVYVFVGELVVTLKDPDGRTEETKLHDGESFNVPAGVLHRLATPEGSSARFVELYVSGEQAGIQRIYDPPPGDDEVRWSVTEADEDEDEDGEDLTDGDTE